MIDPKNVELIFYKDNEVIVINKNASIYIHFYDQLKKLDLFNCPCIDYTYAKDSPEDDALIHGEWKSIKDSEIVDWVCGSYEALPEDFKTKLLLMGL